MKAKRLIGIIAVCLVGIIACGIIASAFIPKSFSLDVSEANSIIVYQKSGKSDFSVEKGTENFDKIMELFNNGFRTNVLSSFFQGNLSYEVSTELNSYNNLTKETLQSKDDIIYLDFRFSTEQEVDRHGNDETISEEKLKYRSMVVEIRNSNSMTEINAYLRKSDATTSYVKYKVIASHADLYNFVSTLNY